jgi:Uma2 family endonuclease
LDLNELWVINAETLLTTIHREPQPTRYANVENRQPNERIEPIRAPSLAVTLDLG